MKQTTVFKQLIRNIIIPLIFAVVLFSSISYYYNRRELVSYYTESRHRIVEEIKNLLSLYDFSMRIHEHEYSDRMKNVSALLVNKINDDKLNPETTDLYKLSIELGVDTTSEFIYIIDTAGVIVNTTFKKDKGLDFKTIDPFFQKFFNKLRKDKVFVEDRFSKEIVTNKIKKYAYQPTTDGKFIVELGFYSQKAIDLRELLMSEIGSISENYEEIKKITLIMAIANAKDPDVPLKDSVFFNTALLEKRNTRVVEDKDSIVNYTDYIYIDMMSTSMFDGYVIKMNSNDIKERLLVKKEIKKFGFIFLITVIPLILLVYFRARRITNPIKKLITKVKIIRGGNLSERIEIEGNNEISELSVNFNKMVSDLQESYEGLEQKVRDRTVEISHQKELIEEKNKEITDSINYAQRIQRSLLASNQLLDNQLKDYFVFFQPKDIVSGDFYWGHILADGTFALVTADSTGHGVPGAIMSMLNISCLNEAVNAQKLTSTSEILNYTRNAIIQHLANDGSAEGGKDGMDCSLLKLDIENCKLWYSAANNPVWIVRKVYEANNQNVDLELLEFAPDKMPVGKHDRDKVPFIEHEIQLQKGDVVYTLTDGMPDQFGGPKGKKFMYKQLKEFLTEISHFPMLEQKAKLKERLTSWKGELEQVDDICIIGIRI